MSNLTFSGVQPTGNLHLGNYLGAIKQFGKTEGDGLFCVVDLHAITAGHDPKTLRKNTLEIAAALIASLPDGDDRTQHNVFVQSHVPMHSEMQWLLSSVARMGWLERMTQYREKTNSTPPEGLRETLGRVKKVLVGSNPHFPVAIPPQNGIDRFGAKVLAEACCAFDYNDVLAMYDMLSRATSNQEAASVGLFTYPVLMAADILVYNATHVPVGSDQVQHLNLARDIAKKFNKTYGDTFAIPEPVFSPSSRVMSLKDGTRKMSKSDPDDGSRINLTDSDDVIAKKIKRATAHTELFPSSDEQLVALEPDVACASVANLINIYVACSGEPRETVFEQFGGKGYGTFKPALADVVIAEISPIRNEMAFLLNDTSYLGKMLMDGANYAIDQAQPVLNKARFNMGFYE
jgi:tryptophanyl-tRNA synthetase